MSADWSLVAADIDAAMKAFGHKPVDRAGNEQLNLIDASPR
jgi:hypothetical protein